MFTKTIKVVSRFFTFVMYFALMGCELPVSLLGPGGGGDGASGFTADGGGSGFATIHNPEPATMLLMGGGIMAMKFYKNKMKK